MLQVSEANKIFDFRKLLHEQGPQGLWGCSSGCPVTLGRKWRNEAIYAVVIQVMFIIVKFAIQIESESGATHEGNGQSGNIRQGECAIPVQASHQASSGCY
jgi:hypothetical protein